VDVGFTDLQRLLDDKRLEPLRSHEAYKSIVARLKAAGKAYAD